MGMARKHVALLMLVLSINQALGAVSMNQEFLEGFESGIHQRNNDELQGAYGCPDADKKTDQAKQMEMLMGSLRTLSTQFGGTKMMESYIEQLETFVGTMNKLAAVFDYNYEGGDFCAGLLFGREGALMLTRVATQMFE